VNVPSDPWTQAAEQLNDTVAAPVVARQGPVAGDVPDGVLGDQLGHRGHVILGEGVECPTDTLSVGVLSHYGSFEGWVSGSLCR
jgi:hypothetical protein